VADRFHVTKTGNDALEKIRRKIWRTLDAESRTKFKVDRHKLKKRKKDLSNDEVIRLEEVLALSAELRSAYQAKENFFNLYEFTNKAEAEDSAHEWLSTLPTPLRSSFKQCINLLTHWRKEILNFYDHRVSNGFTESMNKKINDIERAGRGYAFEVIRAKLLFNEKPRMKTQKSITRKIRQETRALYFAGGSASNQKIYETVIIEATIEFGPHIPTLIEMITKKEII
jgi:transposase